MEKITKLELGKFIEGDVFHFNWSPETIKEMGAMVTHCFQGILMVLKNGDGELEFYDTYWGIGGKGGKYLSLDKLNKELSKGAHLTYYCNMNDLEQISEHETVYYDDEDLFDLASQNRCHPSCISYYKKRGAKRSQAKMISVMEEKIKDKENVIKHAQWGIERYNLALKEIQTTKDINSIVLP